MSLTWLWLLPALLMVGVTCDRGGSSLRGALEALQRRQRGHSRGPVATVTDYDQFYDIPPQPPYAESDYIDIENTDDEPSPKYIIKFLDENERPSEAYEYKIIKKKNVIKDTNTNKKESPFRERSQRGDTGSLEKLFTGGGDEEREEKKDQLKEENDEEYAVLLNHLWNKYKKNKGDSTQGVVKLFKEKSARKRYPDNWGPIAFKRKRSSGPENIPLADLDGGRKPHGDGMPIDPNYNSYDLTDEDKDDLREEYAIAFQPLDDDDLSDQVNDQQYTYDTMRKRFPVTKRSSNSYNMEKTIKKKRLIEEHDKRHYLKSLRSSSGTDPKIIKDLSKLFGDPEINYIKKTVKRSNNDKEDNETYKPPQISAQSHNDSHQVMNTTIQDENTEHVHLHHPGMMAKEADHVDHDTPVDSKKPISIKKKSIDWSDYFGIDKRKKKSVPFVRDLNEKRLKQHYLSTFNKEVIYPASNVNKYRKVKRNFGGKNPTEDTEIEINSAHAVSIKSDDKRDIDHENNAKLDSIDKKIKNVEDLIVDEALHYSIDGEEIDSKEVQETKEKMLSKLAAAYSLEKMRKALKEFKQSIQLQKSEHNFKNSSPIEDVKEKRVAVKKELVNSDELNDNHLYTIDDPDEFEKEQGAGHYLNGKIEEPFSEGYMGGSGRLGVPSLPTVVSSGSCPVLSKIIQRCRGVDLLAGDRGQLFLPLCSLHQICYLCGEAPQTTCDLVFLSEADTACEGEMGCQRAARAALMALRELHDSLADELDGECEASPCLPATLRLNYNWIRALQR